MLRGQPEPRNARQNQLPEQAGCEDWASQLPGHSALSQVKACDDYVLLQGKRQQAREAQSSAQNPAQRQPVHDQSTATEEAQLHIQSDSEHEIPPEPELLERDQQGQPP